MAYNRIGRPKFYIDAVLLARKLGLVVIDNHFYNTALDSGIFYLNPTKLTTLLTDDYGSTHLSIEFNHRWVCNSLTHYFVLGHQLGTDEIATYMGLYEVNDNGTPSSSSFFPLNSLEGTVTNNGWNKFDLPQSTTQNHTRLYVFFSGDSAEQSFNIGDLSIGWSYEMPNSPDMELTQTFGNESLKTQTTKSGHTLTNTSYNQPPKWGNYPQWKRSSQNIAYPARRSWSLKFSYLADENSDNSGLMPQYYNELDAGNNNRGIFERTSVTLDDPLTGDEDESSSSFSIKNDFLSKVMPCINLGLPFIFQPDSSVEEYAIARVNADSVTMNQVSHNVYDISFSIVETW